MSSYTAEIHWSRGEAVFTDNRYSRKPQGVKPQGVRASFVILKPSGHGASHFASQSPISRS